VIILMANTSWDSSAMIDRAGWPATFIVHSAWDQRTSVVPHALVLDLAVWAGIVLAVWYTTGKLGGSKTVKGED
jgi:hypothetical protein